MTASSRRRHPSSHQWHPRSAVRALLPFMPLPTTSTRPATRYMNASRTGSPCIRRVQARWGCTSSRWLATAAGEEAPAPLMRTRRKHSGLRRRSFSSEGGRSTFSGRPTTGASLFSCMLARASRLTGGPCRYFPASRSHVWSAVIWMDQNAIMDGMDKTRMFQR